MTRIRASLSYANVIATIALFVALGGGAYAATQLPKNSVGSKQLKANAVNSSKVKNGSLLSQDFAPGQLPSGAQGPQGPQGAPGAKGDTGAPGTPGAPAPGGLVTGNVSGVGLSSSSSVYGAVSGPSVETSDHRGNSTLSPNVDIVVRDLEVRANSAATAGVTVTLEVNDGTTALTCAVIGSAGATCHSDGPVTVPAGSIMQMRVTTASCTTSCTTELLEYGFRATPAS